MASIDLPSVYKIILDWFSSVNNEITASVSVLQVKPLALYWKTVNIFRLKNDRIKSGRNEVSLSSKSLNRCLKILLNEQLLRKLSFNFWFGKHSLEPVCHLSDELRFRLKKSALHIGRKPFNSRAKQKYSYAWLLNKAYYKRRSSSLLYNVGEETFFCWFASTTCSFGACFKCHLLT